MGTCAEEIEPRTDGDEDTVQVLAAATTTVDSERASSTIYRAVTDGISSKFYELSNSHLLSPLRLLVDGTRSTSHGLGVFDSTSEPRKGSIWSSRRLQRLQ